MQRPYAFPQAGLAARSRVPEMDRGELIAQGHPASFPVMRWTRLLVALVAHSLRHPATGVALLRVGWRFRRNEWWRRAPFVPVPSGAYVRWRLQTAYGDEHIVPPAGDVIRYARWAVLG